VAIGGVVINFTARTRDAVREVGKLTNELRDVDGKSRSAGKKLSTLGKVGFGAVAAGAAAAAGFMFDAVEAAAEDARSAQILADVLRNTTDATDAVIGSTEEWITRMQLATEVADTDLRQALVTLLPVTEDAAKAQQLVAVALDASVATGKPLPGIVSALAKAAEGNTSALKRQFPFLDDGKDKTLTLSDAVQQLSDKYDGAAEAAAIANGPLDELRSVFDETKEALGARLLPKMQEFAAWIKSPDGMQAVEDLTAAAEGFADAVVAIGSAAGTTSERLGNLFGPFVRAWNALPKWLQDWIKGGMPIVPGYGNVNRLPQAPNPPPSRAGNVTGGAYAGSNGVTINNYYPKPERASESTAMSLRIARNAVL
jgi:hypothetical protein